MSQFAEFLLAGSSPDFEPDRLQIIGTYFPLYFFFSYKEGGLREGGTFDQTNDRRETTRDQVSPTLAWSSGMPKHSRILANRVFFRSVPLHYTKERNITLKGEPPVGHLLF